MQIGISLAMSRDGRRNSPDVFTPSVLAPHFWLAAYKESFSNSAAVTTPTDWSGNGRAPTQATGANKPLFATALINGKAAFTFDDVAYWAFGDVFSSLTAGAEAFLVFRGIAGTSHATWTMGSDVAGDYIPFGSHTVYDGFGSSVRKACGDPTAIDFSQFNLYNVTTTAAGFTSRFNGTQLFTTATNTVGWSTAPLLGKNVQNSFFGAASNHTSAIAELIIIPSGLSSTDRNKMGGYIQTTYGITVAGATF